MKVDVYAICWNEADMLGFFFRQYDDIAYRYIVFDDGSTDGSLDILRRHPNVEVRPLPSRIDDSYVLTAKKLHDTVWKESRGLADWVIITAIDEHLVHPDLNGYLRQCLQSGITLVPAVGYQMIWDTFPADDAALAQIISEGAPFAPMSKLCIFRPDSIHETHFGPGRHTAEPQGDIRYPDRDEVLNLHFKYMDFDRVFARHQLLASGLGSTDLNNGWGHRYLFEKSRLRRDWQYFADRSIDLRKARPNAVDFNEEPRWWRKNAEAKLHQGDNR